MTDTPNPNREDSEEVREDSLTNEGTVQDIFNDIVKLRVGEALLFCPNATVGLTAGADEETSLRRLGFGYIKFKIRNRLTDDGGKSVLAV